MALSETELKIKLLKGKLQLHQKIHAFMGCCIRCNHMNADEGYDRLEQYFSRHNAKCHRGQPEDFTIWRLNPQEYMAYLEHKGNPVFWRAWNNKAKIRLENIPFFVMVVGRLSLLCKC